MNSSVLAIATVPLVTGVIGYVTNWTGVLMLFYPVHFKGIRAPWLRNVARMLPYKVRQIPGVMVGGIGWQGIVPARAAKMGSPLLIASVTGSTTKPFSSMLSI